MRERIGSHLAEETMEVNVADSETPVEQQTTAAPAGKPRGKIARRKAGRPRKPAGRRRKASSRMRPARGSASFAVLLRRFASKASDAGAGVAALSGEGAAAARRTLSQATTASKKTIGRLTKEWKRMDTRRKAQVAAAVLGALAAASAPFVRNRIRRK